MNDYRELHELYHFGTDGMKWGRSRYQNEDGSYKPGAEGRYYDEVGGSRKGSKSKTESNKKSSNKSSSNSNEKKSSETVNRVKHFVSSHKKEIAIGAAATTALIAGVVLYKSGVLKKAGSSNSKPDISDMPRLTKHPNNPGGGGGAAKIVTETAKKAANAPDFKVTPNSTKAAVEAAKKAAQSAPRANTQTITKGAEDLARATKKQQTETQKIIDAVDSGSDYVNQLLKENEEMLKKIRNGGA